MRIVRGGFVTDVARGVARPFRAALRRGSSPALPYVLTSLNARTAGYETGCRKLWQLFLEATGERAYRTYCDHVRAHHPERPVPSEREFYVQRLRDKYAGVNRCC